MTGDVPSGDESDAHRSCPEEGRSVVPIYEEKQLLFAMSPSGVVDYIMTFTTYFFVHTKSVSGRQNRSLNLIVIPFF